MREEEKTGVRREELEVRSQELGLRIKHAVFVMFSDYKRGLPRPI
jgi:hypothetical protein